MNSPSSPPPGSYPASLPPGWTAQWNEQYKAWYFFNSQTNVSQWEHPGQAQQTQQPQQPSSDSQYAEDEALAARLQAEEDSQAAPHPNMNTHPYRGNTAMEESDAALAARLQAEEDALARMQQPSPQVQSPYSPNHMPQHAAFPQHQQQQPYRGDYMSYQQQPQPQQQQQGFGHQGYPQYQTYPNQQYGTYPNQQYAQPQSPPQQQKTGGQSGGFLGKLTDKAKGRLSAAGVNMPASGGTASGLAGLGNSALAGFKDKLKTKNKPAQPQPQNSNSNSNTSGYPMYGAYVYDNGGGHHGGNHGGHHGGGGHHSGGHHSGDGGGGGGGDGGGGASGG